MTLLDSGKGLGWGYLNHGKSQHAVEAKRLSIKRISHFGTLWRDGYGGTLVQIQLDFEGRGE